MSGQKQSKQSEDVIDESLRRVYQEAVDEGIPDRFKSLLEQLKQQDAEQGKGK
ncbi:MAG: NepR family anti-sigma factor [Sulfitobacter sp.]|nr:NepR family anti-sigma factor [Sulfitobacter sp.]MDG1352487.1 NepR family anti-sigma factor [Sulfitobacter sp.]